MADLSTVHAFPLAAAQEVALVLAAEEVDRQGRLLPATLRREATENARGAGAASETIGGRPVAQWLAARAAALVPHLSAREDLAAARVLTPRLLATTDPVRHILAPAVGIGLVVGLLTNALGPSRQIHVLALPLFGILLWNVVMLTLIVWQRVLPMPIAAPRLASSMRGLVERTIRRAIGNGAGDRAGNGRPGAGGRDPTGQIVARYLSLWSRASAPLATARVSRALHAGSLALTAGVIGGMYIRGLGFAYHVTWESTFLSAQTVQRLLDTVLAPASLLSCIGVPSVAMIAAGGGEPATAIASAAPWIHLWAVTAAWVVGVPRLFLLAVAAWQCRARQRHVVLELPAAYLRRLLSAADPEARSIDVLLYSYQASTAATTALRALLMDLFGARSEVRLRSLAYGEPDVARPTGSGAPELASPESVLTGRGSGAAPTPSPAASAARSDSSARCRLVLFSLAQTPEVEVHGALVAGLVESLGEGQALLVAIDASAYRKRLGDAGKTRIEDRQRAWGRIFHESGVTPLFFDLEAHEPATEQVLNAAWPAGILDALKRTA